MITPHDIQEKEFTKGVRGYKEDEVNAFLDLVTLDMDKLIQENRVLKEQVRSLNEDLERQKTSEGSIFETLEAAKALMADISASAEKRAEIVLKNAELEADRIQKDARESVERLHEEAASLTTRWTQFKTRYKNLLENEIERFDGLTADFLIDSELEDLKALPDTRIEEPKPKAKKRASSPSQSQDKKKSTIKTTKRKTGV